MLYNINMDTWAYKILALGCIWYSIAEFVCYSRSPGFEFTIIRRVYTIHPSTCPGVALRPRDALPWSFRLRRTVVPKGRIAGVLRIENSSAMARRKSAASRSPNPTWREPRLSTVHQSARRTPFATTPFLQ